jgi:hypothetical protein
LPSDKVKVDLAFAAAWRGWGYRDRFPQVSTDIGKGSDGLRALTRANPSKRVVGVHWTMEGHRHVIATRDPEWSVEDPADVQYAAEIIDGDVPIEGWVSLAEDLLRRLSR